MDSCQRIPQATSNKGDNSEQRGEKEKGRETKRNVSDQFKEPAMHYIAEKAGMETVDKEKIQKLISEISKGSDYYKREQDRTLKAKEKAKVYQQKIDACKSNPKLWKQMQGDVKRIL